jgi:uncharacterized membrane protein
MDNDRRRLPGMTPIRIQALNDGVFAIAMTLLILRIQTPDGSQDASSLVNFFTHASSQFFDYGLSFILLAFLWTGQHRQFHWIKRTDDGLLWLNMIFLLFVAMVPVATSLYGAYRDLWPAALFINMNLLLVFLILYLMWFYATNHRELLDPSLTPGHIAFTRRPSLAAIPVLSLTAIILSVIVPAWSTLPYVLVPIIMTRRNKEA